MRRASTSPSISLFPFLAVLVCAMGALILLLLVTTRKMRQAAVARAAAEAEAVEEATRPPPVPPAMPPQLPEPEPTVTGPSPEDLDQQRAERQRANALARKRQSARQAEWRRSLAEAEIARDQRRLRLAQSEADLAELQQKLEETETHLQRLTDKKSQLKTVFEKESKQRKEAELEHERLTAAIAAAQKELADLRRAHADEASKFAFIPYDGASGTTRRPIYIECTSTGIRFQPENELLDESDLKGFTETFNPLLSASKELMQYWREQSVAKDDPRNPMRPYILILVRPKGTVAYYVARKMLSQLGDDFGYELIEDDLELQLPPPDPEAKLTIQRAVAETLRNRGEMIAVGSRVGAPRLGEVLMGRNEQLIEFGTLDDQLAATVARDESPFTKNSGLQGRGFQVTRSPIEKDEIKSGSMHGTRAERDRRRAHGVPGSLAEVAGQKGEPTGLPDEPYSGPTAVGKSGESRAITGTDSMPAGASTGSDLIDPFDRDPLPTGLQAPGGSSQSERLPGNSTGKLTGTASRAEEPTGTRQGSRTSPRLNNRIPQGARAGKVIELQQKESPLNDAAGTVGEGDVATGGREASDPAAGSRSASRSNNAAVQGARAGKVIDLPSNAQPINDEPDPFSKSPQSATTGTPAEGRPSDGRQRAGMKSRSTDPQAMPERIYGDNPEARRQLSASPAKTTMQKRDAARRRWGGTNTGQIGFERKVNVALTADRIIVGDNDIEVVIEPGTKPDELLESVLSALDEHSQVWGKPPSRFYWVPYINFDVYNGANSQYEQLHGPLREWGIFSEAKFKEGTQPPPKVENAIQPVSKTTPDKTAPAKPPVKMIGPKEAAAKKPDAEKSAPKEKSRFSWFTNSWFK